VIERREINRELPFVLVVGVALPKGDRQKWLVEKLTELGASTLVPLITERGVAQPATSAIDRLQRTVIESSKQCGRNRLMTIAEPQRWSEWTRDDCGFGIADCGLPDQSAIRNSKSEIDVRRLVAHPGGSPLREIDLRQPRPTQLAIGPEGGLTDTEVAAALAAGWQQVDLGLRILRVETAAIALAAAISLG
jgi:16S rRNA (uracil1498-N3)-methyltransferase